MSGSSSVYAAVLALSVAFAGFSVFSVWAPEGLPVGAVWEGGLIREVVFEGSGFKALNIVQASLVYRNPTTRPVLLNVTYPVRWARYVDGSLDGSGSYGSEGFWELVMVPAGGEYSVCGAGFQPIVGGWYEVDWDGAVWGIAIAEGDILPRIRTDMEEYPYGVSGTATIEYYNPRTYPATFYPPGIFKIDRVYAEGDEETIKFACVDWAQSSYTLAPGEVFTIDSFGFINQRAGSSVIEGLGASVAIRVLPRP